jgi:hypothetical protein
MLRWHCTDRDVNDEKYGDLYPLSTLHVGGAKIRRHPPTGWHLFPVTPPF